VRQAIGAERRRRTQARAAESWGESSLQSRLLYRVVSCSLCSAWELSENGRDCVSPAVTQEARAHMIPRRGLPHHCRSAATPTHYCTILCVHLQPSLCACAAHALSSAKQGSRSIRRETVECVANPVRRTADGQPHPQGPRPASSPPVNIEAKFTLPSTSTLSTPPSLLPMIHLPRSPRLPQASS
jgi:hypothetical protein